MRLALAPRVGDAALRNVQLAHRQLLAGRLEVGNDYQGPEMAL